MTSFANKKGLRFVITLGTNSFNDTGDNQITIEGFRASVACENAGWLQMGELRAQIFGMSKSDMNAVTTYPLNALRETKNTIVVFAIDGENESVVFAGNMVRAWPDFARAPDVCLHIQAQAAMSAALQTVAPRSFKASTDVAAVMKQIATSMGLSFENGGVDVKLADTYLANSDLEQARELARTAGIEFTIERGILAIWPKGSHRNAYVPYLSKDTGLLTYPTFDGTYVRAQCLYNSSLITGGVVQIESDNDNARGEWQVLKMSHQLESEKPGGAWFSNIIGVSLSYYGRQN